MNLLEQITSLWEHKHKSQKGEWHTITGHIALSVSF